MKHTISLALAGSLFLALAGMQPVHAAVDAARAWLGRERAVMLAHTGHPDTVISSLGTVLQEESETLEFIDRVSSARYPVDDIQSIVWQHNNLGEVTADRENLAAAIRGYSLLKFSYRTRAQHWRVSLAADEEGQFVLIDV